MAKQIEQEPNTSPSLLKCGIVMPISAIDGCSAEHWTDVLDILKESIASSGFEANLVSDSDDSGIIHKRIVQNLYTNEIIVCDVSAKNPNVMFELGMRLAFDKPTIIVKDDKTDYSFDTSVIEHLTYPRDLRFGKINLFKENLAKKIKSTYEKATTDSSYTTFLKHFGEYKVAGLSQNEITSDKYLISMVEELKGEISLLRRTQQSNIKHRVSGWENVSEESQRMSDLRKFVVMKHLTKFMKEKNYSKLDFDSPKQLDEVMAYLFSQQEIKDLTAGPSSIRRILDSIAIEDLYFKP